MLLNPDRAAYLGLLGHWSRGVHGSLNVYVSLSGYFQIAIDGGPSQQAELAVVPAYAEHLIVSEHRVIGMVQLENETLLPDQLPTFLRGSGPREDPVLRDRMRTAFALLRAGDPAVDPQTVDIDTLFFGAPIGRRRLDPRIAMVVDRVRQWCCPPLDAATGAHLAGLSCSRFRYLFKNEVGTTYKRFRAWKRARSVMPYLSTQPNLSDLALALGFADSTHFSHSIRSFWGLRPRDIFSGSRRLAVVVQSLSAPALQAG
jgi:AraC-like DNA-binding protein